jgi:hypothetical protein
MGLLAYAAYALCVLALVWAACALDRWWKP